jgi:hypothetical protein
LDDKAPVQEEPLTAAESSDYKVWGGAAAEAVTNQGPIMDEVVDDDTGGSFSEQIQSFASDAGERYAEVTRAVSEAFFATPSFGDRAASAASDQYSRAIAAASSVLYGTTPSPGEHFTSAASEKYSKAVAA